MADNKEVTELFEARSSAVVETSPPRGGGSSPRGDAAGSLAAESGERLRIALAQLSAGLDPDENLTVITEQIAAAGEAGAALVVFPEAAMACFAATLAEVAQPLDGPFASGVRAAAAAASVIAVVGMFTPASESEAADVPLDRSAEMVAPASGAGVLGAPEDELGEVAAAASDAGVLGVSQEHSADVVGSAPEVGASQDDTAEAVAPALDSRVHNTLLITGPGIETHYDKVHLYDACGSQESATVAPGKSLVTIDVLGTRIGFATCYDLRFPDQFTELGRRGAQLVVVPASWADGPGKFEQWDVLTRARAMDSQAFLAACDQAWTPPQGAIALGIGHSRVVDPYGKLVGALDGDAGMLIVDIDLTTADEARRKLPILSSGSLTSDPHDDSD